MTMEAFMLIMKTMAALETFIRIPVTFTPASRTNAFTFTIAFWAAMFFRLLITTAI